MTNQLNIKYLVKGMRVQDKAKLLFAHWDKKAEASDHKGILSPEEEKALIDDAQDLRQITELNRLNKLYNLANFIVLDIQTSYKNFRFAEMKMLSVLIGIILVGEERDILERIIYDLAVQNTDKKLEEIEFQKEVDQKAIKLRKKYKVGEGMAVDFDYLEPSLRNESYYSTGIGPQSEPNKFIQKTFMLVISEIKDFKIKTYQYEYVVSKAGIELLSGMQKETIEGFKTEINNFVCLDGYLGMIKAYGVFAEKGYIKTTDLSEPGFLDAIKDIEKATNLNNKNFEDARKEIDNAEFKYQE